jgi:hypothetical protein
MFEVKPKEGSILKKLGATFAACGFAIAHYLYIVTYHLFNFLSRYEDSLSTALFYIAVAALFFWLLRRARQMKTFSSIFLIFCVYFGERIFSIATFLSILDYSAAIVQTMICAPVIVFLIRGVYASVKLSSYRSEQGKTPAKKSQKMTVTE